MVVDFSTVTELSGDDVTIEQVERMCHRYIWASTFCRDRDVIEIACGMGQGLGLLMSVARSVRAGDYDQTIRQAAQDVYGERIAIDHVDAEELPYEGNSADVVILFEALYYLPEPGRFIQECRRVLRPGGKVLIVNANKDLYDFNPSPFSYSYHGVVELAELFVPQEFSVEFFGYHSYRQVGRWQQVLRGLKMVAAKFGLIPKTMKGKKLLKRFVFGRLVPMPREVTLDLVEYSEPVPLAADKPDRDHKVIYCVATLPAEQDQ